MASATENRLINIYINGEQAGKTLKDIRKLRNKLNNEIYAGELSEEEYQKKVRDLNKLDGVLRKHRENVRGVRSSWSKVKDVMLGVFGGITASGILNKFKNMIGSIASKNYDLSDSMADVQKTTGLTDKELKELIKDLDQLDTRTPRDQLMDLAVSAGKLGVKGKKDVLEFVRAADQINVALGEDLGEGAVKALGKLNENLGVTDQLGLQQGLLATGSAINELGQNSTASEGYIADFATRLGGVAKQADISVQNLLAYGSTLDQLGQKQEMAATATSKFIVGMLKDPAEFAKAAGLEVDSFVKLVKKDANEAFIQLLEGLNKNSDGLGTLAQRLDMVGEDGARSVQVISALAGKTDILRSEQELSNKAFAEATSLSDEFARKNENMAGTLDKISQYFTNKLSGTSIVRGVQELVSGFWDWLRTPISEEMEKDRKNLGLLHLQIIDANTSSDDRLKLIKELKTEYPDYLGHIDAETISNSELTTEIEKVNQALINKIILQRKDEEIEAQNEKVATKRMDLIDRETELRERLLKLADEHGIQLKEGLSTVEQARNVMSQLPKSRMGQSIWSDRSQLAGDIRAVENAQMDLNTVEYQNNKLLQERTKLMEELGITMEKVKETAEESATGDDGDPTIPGIPDEEALKEAQKKLDQLREKIEDAKNKQSVDALEGREKELQEAKIKYDELITLAKDHASEKKEIETWYRKEKERINQEFDQKDKEKIEELRTKVREGQLEDYELEKFQRMEYWREILEEYEKFGLDVEEAKRAMNADLARMEDEHQKKEEEKTQRHNDKLIADKKRRAREEARIYQELGSAGQEFLSTLAGSQERYSTFHKASVVAQTFLDTAAAISSLTAMSEANPANAVTFGGAGAAQFAAGILRIMSNIARAVQVLDGANTPRYAKGTGLHRGGDALINEYGPEMITSPSGTRVFTAASSMNILKDILSGADRSLNVDTALESSDSPVRGGGAGSAQMDALIASNVQISQQLEMQRKEMQKWQKEIKVKFVQEDYDDFQYQNDLTRNLSNLSFTKN